LYLGSKNLIGQITTLAAAFGVQASGALRYAEDVLSKSTIPAGAEGYFAVINQNAIARKIIDPRMADDGFRYRFAVSTVLDRLALVRTNVFYNPSMFKRGCHVVAQTASCVALLTAEQNDNDIIIIPAQLGLGFKDHSPVDARCCVGSEEFCLGTVEVGSILIANPERFLNNFSGLNIHCSGDVWNDSKVPKFASGQSTPGLTLDWVPDDENDLFSGTATGFLTNL
jgi:hypothetical protein